MHHTTPTPATIQCPPYPPQRQLFSRLRFKHQHNCPHQCRPHRAHNKWHRMRRHHDGYPTKRRPNVWPAHKHSPHFDDDIIAAIVEASSVAFAPIHRHRCPNSDWPKRFVCAAIAICSASHEIEFKSIYRQRRQLLLQPITTIRINFVLRI